MSYVRWPDSEYYRDMVRTYATAFGHSMDGIIPDTSRSPPFIYDKKTESSLDRDIYDAFLDKLNGASSVYISMFSQVPGAYGSIIYNQVQFVKKVAVDSAGLIFATEKGAQRNSYIIFKHADGTEHPGQIGNIFYHQRYDHTSQKTVVEPFFVVRPFVALSEVHATMDPYRIFEGLNTQLFYARTKGSVVLRQTDIVSHFAAYTYIPVGIDEECVVVRSLDRE